MQRADNLIGEKFGLLTVIRRTESGNRGKSRWICLCDCGSEYELYGQNLKKGTDSCGCLTKQKKKDAVKTHKMSDTREYRTWQGIKQRCLNPKNDRWESYGGRGIAVCDRWLGFENFYADMGTRPEGTSIDRIDNDKGYYPDNCRWATAIEQQNNMRSNNRFSFDKSVSKFEKYDYNGASKTLTEWCRLLNLNFQMVATRIKRGWNIDKAFKTPCDSNQIELTFGGEIKSIKEWREIVNIDHTTLYTRWKRGWTDERILTTPVKKKQAEYSELEYNGKTQSLSEWCKELNLKRRIIWKRLKRGWSVKDCFEIQILNNSLKLKNIRKGRS